MIIVEVKQYLWNKIFHCQSSYSHLWK